MITYESLPPSHSKHGQPLLILPRQLLYAVTMTITTVDWEIFTLKIINFRIKKYFIARWAWWSWLSDQNTDNLSQGPWVDSQ